MSELSEEVSRIADEIEEALWAWDVPGDIERALAVYRQAEQKLQALDLAADHPAYATQQRVLAYCLMRQGNVLRHLGEPEQALALGRRELAAASRCGEDIQWGRSLISNGTNYVVAGAVSQGLEKMEQARALFQSGDSHDHQQGLGWYWILQADLANGGVITRDPGEVVAVANRAIKILKPIENWPGVARAYAARANAHDALGDGNQAAKDRTDEQYYAGLGSARAGCAGGEEKPRRSEQGSGSQNRNDER